MHRLAAFALWLWLGLGACARAPREPARAEPDSAAAAAIARDRPERLVVPLAGAGTLRLERVSIARGSLEHAAPIPPAEVTPAEPVFEPPSPQPAEPGEPHSPQAAEPSSADERSLQPPIPRGAPAPSNAGRAAVSSRGNARVTLDVRVDENGDVSDALLVESDADSVTVQAAIEAAMGVRYHPALLGGKPVAVWTRQVLHMRRPGAPR